ncbi:MULTISPECIES: hypothetical protein [Nostoc]|uniref:Uncharacterized protein n=2 Tax=Nostoc TaxID=1177 RepID=A0ABR8IKK9_9NOSO|nr:MULTISPECIES: hypothetical protein [Nostoc]MBD2563938.1 hypothetical protein [Nostoc linckia FACHB-391]MBD2650845.1 hypothetical protein [Nostoc foliaceum FACHB-393]
MKPSWRTAIILTAIAGAIITTILIFQSTKQPSIALTEEWIATQVASTMPKLPQCDYCLRYSHNPHLVCTVHPSALYQQPPYPLASKVWSKLQFLKCLVG